MILTLTLKSGFALTPSVSGHTNLAVNLLDALRSSEQESGAAHRTHRAFRCVRALLAVRWTSAAKRCYGRVGRGDTEEPIRTTGLARGKSFPFHHHGDWAGAHTRAIVQFEVVAAADADADRIAPRTVCRARARRVCQQISSSTAERTLVFLEKADTSETGSTRGGVRLAVAATHGRDGLRALTACNALAR